MSDERQYDREMREPSAPVQELQGFYKTGKTWEYFCPRCGVRTTGSSRLRNGLVMRAFCCGEWKTKTFTFRDALTMPRAKDSQKSFPVLALDPRGEPGLVRYENADIGGLW